MSSVNGVMFGVVVTPQHRQNTETLVVLLPLEWDTKGEILNGPRRLKVWWSPPRPQKRVRGDNGCWDWVKGLSAIDGTWCWDGACDLLASYMVIFCMTSWHVSIRGKKNYLSERDRLTEPGNGKIIFFSLRSQEKETHYDTYKRETQERVRYLT